MPNEQADIKSDINLTQIHSEHVRQLTPAQLQSVHVPPRPDSMLEDEYRNIIAFSYS